MDRTDLAHDAFKLNGDYLEDLISGYNLTTDTAVNANKVYFSLTGGKYTKVTPVGTENPSTQGWYEKDGYGYMTYKAVGRESLAKEITTYENGTDGETIKKTNFPKRTIEISYVVQGSSLADMRTKMHTLQTKLNVENAEIVFNDDPGSYYIATPIMATVGEAINSVVGTFNLMCFDPFKYSKTLTTVAVTSKTDTVTDEDGNTSSVTSNVLTTDNSGGYKTYPTFNVQFATDENASGNIGSDADCGHVLFAKGGTNYSVQIGDDKEKDTVTTTMVSQDFKKALGSFALANSTPSPFTSHVFQGTIKAETNASKGPGLKASSYGTSVSGKYFGPCVVYNLGSDATGGFEFKWNQVIACAKDTATGKKQAGSCWVLLLNGNNEPVYGVGINKSNTSSTNATYYMYTPVGSDSFGAKSIAYTGKMGFKSTSDTVGRQGDCFIKRWYDSDDSCWQTDIETPYVVGSYVNTTAETVRKVAFIFSQYGSNAFYTNRITEATFVNGNFDNINSFGSGDYATVDCGKAEIILNNEVRNDLGDYANNWEDMYLDVGTNTVYVQYSDWVTVGYEPTISMTYRKRWL